MSERRPTAIDTGERGQTEPLAALVAVALFCLALSTYAVFVTGFVPELGSDRELAEVTTERIWEAVNDDGIYPANTSLTTTLDPQDLPQGYQVAVNVTYEHQGAVTEQDRARFDERGAPTRTGGPPADDVFERPVPVQHRDGDVRPGTLTVVVSDGA